MIDEDILEKENNNTDEVPTFTPPTEENEIPTFTPPEDGEDTIPTFTPPKPGKNNGPKCHNHPEEDAVANCAKCGKPICKECAESCMVSGGGYDGRYLCYDCSKEIFKEDESKLKKDRTKIILRFALFLGGMAAGAALGASDGAGMALILAMIGGSFFSAIKPIISAFGAFISGFFELASGGNIVSAIINIFVGIIKFLWTALVCTINNIIKLIQYTSYLIRANKAINQTKEAIRQLDDFMQYMAVKAANGGRDLSELVAEGGELENNEYARVLREQGEAAADEMLRKATTTIAENGEIIRTFTIE